MRARQSQATLTLLVAIVILLPAMLNGKPFLFYDSQNYFSIGRALVASATRLIDRKMEAPRQQPATGTEGADRRAPVQSAGGGGGGHTAIAGGRSPVYALFVYIASAGFSTWAVVAVQAVIAAWLIVSFLAGTWGTTKAQPVLIVALVLSAFSSLGFTAGFVMPDIFCAVLVLASARLAAEPGMSRPERLVLSGLVLVSVFVHTSILALAGLMLVAAWGLKWLWPDQGAPASRLIPTLAVAVAAGMALNFAYAAAVARLSGHPLGSPPYLMARVIADGPGARYLAEACASDPKTFRVCELSGQKFRNHNDFLWGSGGAVRNFISLPPEAKADLSREEKWFVLEVAKRYPRAMFIAAVHNFVGQLAAVGLEEAHLDEEILRRNAWEDLSILDATPEIDVCRTLRVACPERVTIIEIWSRMVSAIGRLSMLALATLLLWALMQQRRGHKGAFGWHRRELVQAGSIVGFALLANAAVCGILSGAADRYQARIVWLAALIVAASAYALRSMRKEITSV